MVNDISKFMFIGFRRAKSAEIYQSIFDLAIDVMITTNLHIR